MSFYGNALGRFGVHLGGGCLDNATDPGCPMSDLGLDERAILRHLDAAGSSAIAAVVEAIEPYPPRGGYGDDDLWRTAVRRWGRRGRELFTADADLAERGLVGGPRELREITDAGREELARADAEGGGAP